MAGCRWIERRFVASVYASSLCTAVLACHMAEPQTMGPRLSLIDSVLLSESNTAYIGRPGGLYVDSTGRLYVPDMFTERVLRFDARGRFERAFGGPGSGPGEFRGVGDVLLIWNHLLAVQSYGHRRISFFDIESGRPIVDIKYQGTLTSGTRSGSLAWFGSLDPLTRFGVIRFDLHLLGDSSATPISTLIPTIAPVPEAYLTNEAVRGTYGLVQVLSWPDTLLVGYAADDGLVSYDELGRAIDTVVIPVKYRRGVPKDFKQRMSFSTSSYAQMFGLASALFGMWRRPGGSFFLIHMDSNLEGKRSIRSMAFLSLLSANRERACVDATIPASGEGQPKVTARGDTLFVLDQYTAGGQPHVISVVRKYLIDESRCSWLATRGASVQ